MTQGERMPVVVLISGTGTNLQALIDAEHEGAIPICISAVISNRPEARGLARAAQAGVDTRVVDHTAYPDRDDFDRALIRSIDPYRPGLVVLAGFMRVLTPAFVDHYAGRLINIHPSLLPDFRGLHTHERALRAGVKTHGASVHFVDSELDGGPVIMQARVPVLPDDTPDGLAQRVQHREHRLYPAVVGLFATGRLALENGRVRFDGRLLETPLDLDTGLERPQED